MTRWEIRLTVALEYFVGLALLTIAVVIVLQVFLSVAFNSSITGANELVTKLFVYTSTIGAAIAVGRDDHIRISIATERLSPAGQRYASKIGLLAIAGINAVMLGYSFYWIKITGLYVMPTTQLPRFVVQLSVPLGCGIAVAFCIIRLISATPNSPSDREAEAA